MNEISGAPLPVSIAGPVVNPSNISALSYTAMLFVSIARTSYSPAVVAIEYVHGPVADAEPKPPICRYQLAALLWHLQPEAARKREQLREGGRDSVQRAARLAADLRVADRPHILAQRLRALRQAMRDQLVHRAAL